MSTIKPNLPKGTRDFLPEQMFRRKYVVETMRDIFEKYGYQPLETPAIEKLDVLSGKYGDEGEKLIFKILKRGTGLDQLQKTGDAFTVNNYREICDEALRYDLTVPLSRVVAMYQNELIFPFKRYQIQPVWRAERPQRGRFREFYQCDVDTVGTDSMLADAETVAIVYEVLSALGFQRFKIRVNNRKILNGILEHAGVDPRKSIPVLIAIDKMEKVGVDGVKAELLDKGLARTQIEKLFAILEISGDSQAVLDEILKSFGHVEILQEGTHELGQLATHLDELGVPHEYVAIDLNLARGLGYYTGPIYESVVEEPNIGSLSGGGRYDNLIGMFTGRDIPATGTAFGIERIIEVMTEMDMFPEAENKTQVLVTVFDESTRSASLAFAQALRRAELRVETTYSVSKMKKQFTYADKKRIPLVVIIGPDEIASEKITVKDLRSGKQQSFSRSQGVAEVQDYLTQQSPET